MLAFLRRIAPIFIAGSLVVHCAKGGVSDDDGSGEDQPGGSGGSAGQGGAAGAQGTAPAGAGGADAGAGGTGDDASAGAAGSGDDAGGAAPGDDSGGAAGSDGGTGGSGGFGGAAPPCTAKVVLNELQWSGATGDKSDEFIELLNVGDCNVDLDGVEFFRDDVSILVGAASMKITKGKRFLLVGATFDSSEIPNNFGFSNADALADSGCITMVKASVTVDGVCYGPGTDGKTPAPSPPGGQSIARTPDGMDTDNDAADFAIAAVPTPNMVN